MTVRPPEPPKPPTGPAAPSEKPKPLPTAKPTQAPVTTPLPDGTPVTGVVRTRAANIIERVGWTLGEAFFGAFFTALWASKSFGVSDLKAYAFAGGAAALSAVGALVKNIITTRLEG
jgi:hypothetical protein